MVAVFAVLASAPLLLPQQVSVELKRADGTIEVKLAGSPMATLHFAGVARPYIFPFYGPTGAQMLRNYPFKEGVEGEMPDHPHHTGIWFAHGDVNGADIWTRKETMTIVRDPTISGSSVTLDLAMRGADGERVGTCQQTITFGTTGKGARFVDFDVVMRANEGEKLVLGDTKEGTMAIRTHPNLKLVQPNEFKGKLPVGHAVNSEGVTGPAIWGKRAAWVDYWGEVEGRTLGIALFDHPENPRHPTWWHAREYGLFAANPFGVSDFEGKPAGTGDLTLAGGEAVRFRYRFLFHTGDAETAGVATEYTEWAAR
ncbi:MAG: PmoA family protein [Armatimonadetes bacterium]|nr:PmoA family protein [Armatimonadota bacterium]